MATVEQLEALHAMIPFAQASQREFGVPASITLAQWICESAWGRSQLALKCNNFFGVKASHADDFSSYEEFPTAEYESGKRVMVLADFRKYTDPVESFREHAALLAHAARYRPAMRSANHPQAFAAMLQKCGYSTNPGYALLLMTLVRDYGLARYDLPFAPDATQNPTPKEDA